MLLFYLLSSFLPHILFSFFGGREGTGQTAGVGQGGTSGGAEWDMVGRGDWRAERGGVVLELCGWPLHQTQALR